MSNYRISMMLSVLILCASAAKAGDAGPEEFRFAKTLMLDRKEYDLAARKFAAFVESNKSDPLAAEALAYMGTCYGQMSKHGAAEAVYTRLLTEYPDAPQEIREKARLFAGDACFQLDKFADAAAHYGALLEDFPRSSLAEDALYWRAEALYNQGLLEKKAGNSDKASKILAAAVRHYATVLDRYADSKRMPQVLFGAGVASLEAEDYAGAAAFFERLVESGADNARAGEARLYLAECLYRQKQYDAAAEEYSNVIGEKALQTYHARAQGGLAWCRYEQGDPAGAAEAFLRGAAAAKAAEDATEFLTMRYNAGVAYQEAGRLEEAARELSAVTQATDHPLCGEALFRLGLVRAAEGRAEGASDETRRRNLMESAGLLKKALQHPAIGDRGPEAAAFLGETLLDLEDWRGAAHVLGLLAKQWPQSDRAAWALYHKALSLREQKQLDEAAATLSQLAAEYPSSSLRLQAVYALAEYRREMGDAEGARTAYRWLMEKAGAWARAFRDGQGHPDADLIDRADRLASESAFRLGDLLRAEGKAGEAEQLLGKVKARSGGSETGVRALLRLAELAEAAGDWDKAFRHYKEALAAGRDTPEAPEAALRIGLCQLRQAQGETHATRKRAVLESALALLNDFLNRFPEAAERPAGLQARAEALYALGRAEEALADYQAVLETATTGPVRQAALVGAAWCLRDLQNPAEAKKLFAKAVEEFPNGEHTPDALLVLAVEKSEAGDHEGALADLREVARRFPTSGQAAQAAVERARVLSAMGRHGDAITDLNAFVQEHPKHPEAARALYALSWAWWGVAKPKFAEAEKARGRLDDLLRGRAIESLSGDEQAEAERRKSAWESALAAARQDEDRMAAVLLRLAKGYGDFPLVDAVWLRLGEVSYDRGEYERAMLCYKHALQASASGAGMGDKAQYRIGWTHLRQAEGLEEKAAALENGPDKRKALAEARRQRDAARTAFEVLGSTYPGSDLSGEGYFRAAELRRAIRDHAGALAAYRHALRLSPQAEYADAARLGEGLCLLESGKPLEALQRFRDLLKAGADGALAREAACGAGFASIDLDAFEDGRVYFRKALETDDFSTLSARARYGLGLAAYREEKWEQAREEFLKVDAFYAHEAEWASRALLKASEAALRLGESSRARNDLKRILGHYGQSGSAEKAKLALAELE